MKSARPFKYTAALLTALCCGTGAMLAAAEPAQRLIVKYKEAQDVNALQTFSGDVSAKQAVKLSYFRQMALDKRHVFRLDNRVDRARLQQVMAAIAADPRVESVEEDRILTRNKVPNDSRYSEQWDYFEPVGGINVQSAWDQTTGAGVVVAVIDTGYAYHSDLDANIIPGYDFISDLSIANDGNGRDADASDPGDAYAQNECGSGYPPSDSSWHGTHVAGTIGALSDNALGVAGIAHNASIMPVRVLGKCGGYTSDIADAMIWASGGSVAGVPDTATPAKVLNLSLGGVGRCDNTSQAAINAANANGALVVIAAGNSNTNVKNASPANCAGVMAVAANDRNGSRAWYSNYGTLVDITAPGGDTTQTANGILSTLNSGATAPAAESYAFYQGTSMAAPHVAGVAALLFAADPAATAADVSAAMTSTARPLPGTCTGGCGAGIVDATAALEALTGGVVEPPLGGEEIITGLGGTRGSLSYYPVTLPAGMSQLVVTTSGGTGDVALLVQSGQNPTPTSYTCRASVRGNTETCTISNPVAGDWFVALRAVQTYTGVTLTMSWE